MDPEPNEIARPETPEDPPSQDVQARRPSRFLKGCKWTLFIFGMILLALIVWFGPIIRDFAKAGFFNKVEKRNYSGTTMSNLKDMHQAMMLYHGSEDRFPFAEGWMSEVELRIQAGDMNKSESLKKMISPDVAGQPNAYGYAMNDAASAKYKDDVPEPAKTPLIFDSSDLSKNAHGSPHKLLPNPPRSGQNQGISVEGNALKL